MKFKTLDELEVKDKVVLVRAALGSLSPESRLETELLIRTILPTLNYLTRMGAKVLVFSGAEFSPAGTKALSYEPIAHALAQAGKRKLVVLEASVKRLPQYDVPHLYFFKHNLDKADLSPLLAEMRGGDAGILENFAIHEGAAAAFPALGKKLASLGSAFVNEAFADSFRETDFFSYLPQVLPGAAGLGFMKEWQVLKRALDYPKRPVFLFLGGNDLGEKLDLLEGLAKFADTIFLGGAYANLFLRVQGLIVGKSAGISAANERIAREVWRNYKEKIRLPVDVIVSSRAGGEPEWVMANRVRASQSIFDIGPETIRKYSSELRRGQTLIWNGPFGCFREPSYSHGTSALGWLLASRSKTTAAGLAAGGSTLAAIEKLHMSESFDYISLAGKTMLSVFAKKDLPALQVLFHE